MHANANAVVSWFDARAKRYDAQSGRGLWAMVRRWETEAVFAALGDITGKAALELGSGSGFYARQLVQRGAAKVVAVDLSPAMVSALPAPIQGHVGDAATVELSKTFPVVLLAGMLEFVADARAVLANARRHAAPNARLVVLVPRISLMGRGYRAQYKHRGIDIRLFSEADLRADAEASGWRVDQVVVPHSYAIVASLQPRTTA